MIGKYYDNLLLNVNFEVKTWTSNDKITRKQKIKFYQAKIDEVKKLVDYQEDSVSLLKELQGEFSRHQKNLEKELEDQRKERRYKKALREAKVKEAERRKKIFEIKWIQNKNIYGSELKEEKIENLDEVGFIKLQEMGYRSRKNQYEVLFGIMPSPNNLINQVVHRLSNDNWGYEERHSKLKRFVTLEEAEKFYSEKRKEIEEKIKGDAK